MDTLISFDDLKAGAKALKKLAQAFTRAGSPVAATDVDPKTRRIAGVNYRQVQITMTDSQVVTLGVKTTGDIFEVKVNGAVFPVKNQDDQVKAVGEIVKQLDAGRSKFQAKLARQKVALPKGITTAAPKMEERLAQIGSQLDEQIADAKSRANALRAELGEPLLDSVDAVVLDGAVRDAHNALMSEAMAAGRVLKGVAHRSATWKEGDTVEGDVVWVWDAQLPKPYAEGQYPRVGSETWSASSNLFTFSPATPEEIAMLQSEGRIPAAPVVLDAAADPDPKQLSSAAREVLLGLAKLGPLEDGDIPSKSGRNELVELGMVERDNGQNRLTPKGSGCAAMLDDAPSAQLPYLGSTWLGFKLMDIDAAMGASATALPALHPMSGAVRLALADEGGEPIPVLGTVVAITFRAGKVLYSVAVPIAPMTQGARQIMAVVPDIPSEMVESAAEETALDGVGYGAQLKGCKAIVLDAVDVPVNSFDDTTVLEAQQIVGRIAAGDTLDDADFSRAISSLQIALDVVETNYPINLAEGNLAQADLEEKAADSYRAAIVALEAMQSQQAVAA